MAERPDVAPFPADGFRDLVGSSGPVCLAELPGGGYACRLDEAFAAVELPKPGWLGGLCRFQAQGVDIEIELVAESDKRRSVLYLTGGSPIYAFIPDDTYCLRYRFLAGRGTYNATLAMGPLNPTQKLRFYVAKGMQLLRRGPKALTTAVAARMKPRSGEMVAARIAASSPSSSLVTDFRPSRSEPGPGDRPGVSVIIPTRDRVDLLAPCIVSLERLAGPQFEVIVVDNGTIEPRSAAYLSELAGQPGITVLRLDIPFNFSRLCNAGAALAAHDALLFLNDDVEALDGDWLGHMTAWLSDPEVGTVGARLLFPSRDLQHAGIATNLVPGPGHPWRGAAPAVWQSHPLLAAAGEVDAVTGACLLVRRRDFAMVGGFDEVAFATTLNDVDLCLKLRRLGLKSIYTPAATLIHKEGQSRAADDAPGERARRYRELSIFFERYPDWARQSLFYPNNLRRDTDQALHV